MGTACRIGCGLVLMVTLALALTIGGPAIAGVSISIYPPVTIADLGEQLTVYVYVDTAGSDFNAYQTTIRYDPVVLDFVSFQEESLMVNLCGDTFTPPPVLGDSTILIGSVAMCGGLTFTGPGALASLTFTALAEETCEISFDAIACSRLGDLIEDVEGHSGIAMIGEAAGMGDAFDPSGPSDQGSLGPRLTIGPSPCLTNMSVRLTLPRPGPVRVRIFDAQGREIDSPFSGWLPAGTHEIPWGGCARGGELPAGVYLCRVDALGQASQLGRLVMMR
jgi:hypothetical protein